MIYQTLKTEIDKAAYDGKTDTEKTVMLNVPASNVDSDFVNIGVVESYIVKNAFVLAELKALTTAERESLMVLVAGNFVDLGNSNTVDSFREIFAPGSVTRANLIVAAKRFISKSEFLFGVHIPVKIYHIENADKL